MPKMKAPAPAALPSVPVCAVQIPLIVDPARPAEHESAIKALQVCIDRLRAQELICPLISIFESDERVESLRCELVNDEGGYEFYIDMGVRNDDEIEEVQLHNLDEADYLFSPQAMEDMADRLLTLNTSLTGSPSEGVLTLVRAHLDRRSLTRSSLAAVHRALAGAEAYDAWTAATQAQGLTRTTPEAPTPSCARPRM